MKGNIYKGLCLYFVLEDGDVCTEKKELSELLRTVSARWNDAAFLHAIKNGKCSHISGPEKVLQVWLARKDGLIQGGNALVWSCTGIGTDVAEAARDGKVSSVS